jgi:hypothetical protein
MAAARSSQSLLRCDGAMSQDVSVASAGAVLRLQRVQAVMHGMVHAV